MSVRNVIVVCLFELGVSETWNSKSCKCDCVGPTEFPSIRTGSLMVRGVDCMPGMMTSVQSVSCCSWFFSELGLELKFPLSLNLERQQ